MMMTMLEIVYHIHDVLTPMYLHAKWWRITSVASDGGGQAGLSPPASTSAPC